MDRLIAANTVPMAQADTAPLSGTPEGATDGNPATNVPATRWPSYQYNAIQEELIAILAAAGITPDRTNNAQIAAAIRVLIAQSAAVVGDRRNLVSSVTAASATKTVTADEIVVGSAFGGQKYVLANFSATGNLAATPGVNAMDTGAAPVNGFVAEYAIFNPTTGAKGLLYQTVSSAAPSNVYSGAYMPNGYTASALVGIWRTSGSQFVIGIQQDRSIGTVFNLALNTTTAAVTPTSFSVASFVPPGAKSVQVQMGVSENSAGSGVQLSVFSSSTQIGGLTVQAIVTGQTSSSSLVGSTPIMTPQTLWYSTLNTNSVTINIGVNGYSI